MRGGQFLGSFGNYDGDRDDDRNPKGADLVKRAAGMRDRQKKRVVASLGDDDSTNACVHEHNNDADSISGSASTSSFSFGSASAMISDMMEATGTFKPTIGTLQETIEEGEDEDDRSNSKLLRRGKVNLSAAFCGAVVILVCLVSALSKLGTGDRNSSMYTTTTTITTHNDIATDGNPHLKKYSYIFAAYDEVGVALAKQLFGQLQVSMKDHGGGNLTLVDVDRHDYVRSTGMDTGCTQVNLEQGEVAILDDPEFHCSSKKLKKMLMEHRDGSREKWGVKVIHLTRNPFNMAVSNYCRHVQEKVPSQKSPCKPGGTNHMNAGFLADAGIMSRDDFADIFAACNEINDPSYPYNKLLAALPPEKGLRMSVSDESIGLALMANDLIKFREVYEMVDHEWQNKNRNKLRVFDVLTMTLDGWIDYPDSRMKDFLDFVFGKSMPTSSKSRVAAEYAQLPVEQRLPPEAMCDDDMLVDVLRNDTILSGPLGRIEALLESVLSGRTEIER